MVMVYDVIPTQHASGILLVSFLLSTISASLIERLDTLLVKLIAVVGIGSKGAQRTFFVSDTEFSLDGKAWIPLQMRSGSLL